MKLNYQNNIAFINCLKIQKEREIAKSLLIVKEK